MTHQQSRSFREVLRRELPRWREEGLVSPESASALHARYRLGEVESGPGLLPVFILGALLVGAGIISLVAWNWEELPDAAKLSLLAAAIGGFHGVGFWLWKGSGRSPRLGHALTLLGTVTFGASVGLVAQIFHVSGAWWAGFGAFAAGALVAGLAYASGPHLVLAAVLGFGPFGVGFAADHPPAGIGFGYISAAFGLALAVRLGSRALAVVVGLGLAVVLGTASAAATLEAGVPLAITAVAALCAAVPAIARGEAGVRVGAAMQVLGRVLFEAVAFALSFGWVAAELRFRGVVPSLVVTAAAPAFALAAAAIAVGLRRDEVDPLARGEALLVCATFLAFAAGLSVERGAGAALVANLALGFLSIGRIARGLKSLTRAPFWEGIALAGVLALARFLSVDAGLAVKGLAFIAVGAGILAAGFAFERRRVRREATDAS